MVLSERTALKTIGTLFLGTPHHGIKKKFLLAVRISAFFALARVSPMISELGVGSKYLNKLSYDFRRVLEIIPHKMYSFYETRKMRYGLDVVKLPSPKSGSDTDW